MTQRPLRLAVDAHNLLFEVRGIARYVHALLVRFAARDDVALTLLTRELFPRARLRRLIGSDRFRVARAVPSDADVVWHPWNGTFFGSRRPAVVTFHDTAPFRFPSADPRRRRSEQDPFVRSAQTARAFVTNSAFTAREIEALLQVPPERVTVAPLAVEPSVFRPDGAPARVAGDRPYVLLVGFGEARKNGNVLLEAHARAFPDTSVGLVIAGGTVPREVCAHALPIVDSAELAGWYRGAAMVAVPSLYEGFGLPVLEAMACGAPVVAARAAALPEVGGDACVWIDEPRDVAAWALALRALLGDERLREVLRERGLARALEFSWDRCAATTLDVLRGAAAR